jgi:hypothetical protein
MNIDQVTQMMWYSINQFCKKWDFDIVQIDDFQNDTNFGDEIDIMLCVTTTKDETLNFMFIFGKYENNVIVQQYFKCSYEHNQFFIEDIDGECQNDDRLRTYLDQCSGKKRDRDN